MHVLNWWIQRQSLGCSLDCEPSYLMVHASCHVVALYCSGAQCHCKRIHLYNSKQPVEHRLLYAGCVLACDRKQKAQVCMSGILRKKTKNRPSHSHDSVRDESSHYAPGLKPFEYPTWASRGRGLISKITYFSTPLFFDFEASPPHAFDFEA